MKFPLTHPQKMVTNYVADRYTQYTLQEGESTTWGVWKRYVQDAILLDLPLMIKRLIRLVKVLG
jgi:hypothetical protein